MSSLTIDFETRSAVDLKKSGVYSYAEDPSTDVWCAAFAVDDGPIELWRAGEPCPAVIADAVFEGAPIRAFNAAFERIIWKHILAPRYGWPEPDLDQWRCTMVQAMAMSLPASLEMCAASLGLDVSKDMTGRALMLRMAKPRRTDPDGTHVWWSEAEKLERLYAYCRNDVVVERQIEKRLLPLKPSELDLWRLDQRINARGVFVDRQLCEKSKLIVATTQERLDGEIRRVSDMEIRSTNATAQIIGFVRSRGVETESIAKDDLDEILGRQDIPADVRRVVEIRKEAAKTSVAKIDALLAGRSRDGRARGTLQFHATGTGRWAGRRVQPQNLPRPKEKDIDGAIKALLTGDAALVDMLYGAPLSIVSDAVRGMIVAAPGNTLYAADFLNIEGRVLAWLAGEHWKVEAFRAFDTIIPGEFDAKGKPKRKGPDLYLVTASMVLGKPVDQITDDERQGQGKVPELALGYQGGVRAFRKMAVNYGVKIGDAHADDIKVRWREKNPNIKQFWYAIEEAAIEAVAKPGQQIACGRHLAFKKAGSFLFMRLPSGRVIVYPYPKLGEFDTPWGEKKAGLVYKGVDQFTNKWGEQKAYGGLLTNNAVQGIARDVLAEAMLRLEAAGYPIVLTVHDEVVCEVPEGFGSVEEFVSRMQVVPAWADGCPIAAGAWSAVRYKKG